MPYHLINPTPDGPQLYTYATLNHPGEPHTTYQNLRADIRDGKTLPEDVWLLVDDAGSAHAALGVKPYPMRPEWRFGLLRTLPDINEAAATALFKQVLSLSQQAKPIHMGYNLEVARDFGGLPTRLGWAGGDDPSLSYRTDLSGRDDLEPDEAATTLGLDYLLGEDFGTFYGPILAGRSEPDARPVEVVARSIYNLAEPDDGQLYGLRDEEGLVALGVVVTFTVVGERAAGINMLGVAPGKRRRGWGRRLHRHLMWQAKQRSPLYLSNTDASNVAMRRLFELNGCTESDKSWELEPVLTRSLYT